ncbi:hypothetical protein Q2941_28815 [Bradyrhizobium sp. UFLA05-153]
MNLDDPHRSVGARHDVSADEGADFDVGGRAFVDAGNLDILGHLQPDLLAAARFIASTSPSKASMVPRTADGAGGFFAPAARVEVASSVMAIGG